MRVAGYSFCAKAISIRSLASALYHTSAFKPRCARTVTRKNQSWKRTSWTCLLDDRAHDANLERHESGGLEHRIHNPVPSVYESRSDDLICYWYRSTISHSPQELFQ